MREDKIVSLINFLLRIVIYNLLSNYMVFPIFTSKQKLTLWMVSFSLRIDLSINFLARTADSKGRRDHREDNGEDERHPKSIY